VINKVINDFLRDANNFVIYITLTLLIFNNKIDSIIIHRLFETHMLITIFKILTIIRKISLIFYKNSVRDLLTINNYQAME